MHASELWTSSSAKARLLRALLTPLNWLYAGGWTIYLAAYRLGFKRAKEPHRPVVVVGNLAVGGSGKSPTTLHIARLLLRLGHEVVIGCSGYGSPRAEAASLAPDGPLDPKEWGDEAAMFRWLAPEVPLVVGRRRVLAAEIVQQRYPRAVLVMDDGFQHLPLVKHVSIVLDDPEPVNRRCLPAGPYREPRNNLKRADGVVWTRKGEGFWLARNPHRFIRPDGTEVEAPTEATVLCALGQPDRFLAELRSQMRVTDPVLLPDHDPMTSGTLFDRLHSRLPVIVTAKDWVKLRERTDLGNRNFLIAAQDVVIEPTERFPSWLESKLNESKK